MGDLKELADEAAKELLKAIRDQARKASDLKLLQLAQAYSLIVSAETTVNGGRKLTPFRRLKIDPLGVHSSVVDPGTGPRSRSLMR